MNPTQHLASIDAPTAQAFQALRAAVLAAGPLDERVSELVVTACFATTGHEASFKVHARRLLAMQVPVAEIRQAVLLTFGATTTFSDVSQALRWIDELVA